MAYDRKQGQHQVAQSSRPDYRLEVGRAEVPVGTPRGFVVLDPARAATLKAWTSTLIPAVGQTFAECGVEQREGVLRRLQSAGDRDAFSMVSDFTYEAYYGNPDVLAAIEADTGWRGRGPMTGSSMTAFDASRLERVRKL